MSRPIRVFTPGASAPVAARGTAPIAGLVAALAAAAVSPAVRGQCQYEITATIQGPECGIFGFPPTFGTALSDNGEVVGWYTACTIGTDEAFYWSEKTGFVTLDRPPGVYAALAADISEEGTIVGWYRVTELGFRGFVYKGKAWIELPPVDPTSGSSSASAVSPDGQLVVGKRSLTPDESPYSAFLWTSTSCFNDLGVVDDLNTWSSDINAKGTLAGSIGSQGATQGNIGMRWDGAQLVLLDSPKGATQIGISAINSDGMIAGAARVPLQGFDTPVNRPVVWSVDSLPVVLPGLGGYTDAGALAMNDAGIVVGRAHNGPSDERAIAYYGELVSDLNEFIEGTFDGVLERAVALNNSGEILVNGLNGAGEHVTFLLTPIVTFVSDLNGDCEVGVSDMSLLLESWGAGDSPADFDGNGSVGPADLAQLLAEWGDGGKG